MAEYTNKTPIQNKMQVDEAQNTLLASKYANPSIRQSFVDHVLLNLMSSQRYSEHIPSPMSWACSWRVQYINFTASKSLVAKAIIKYIVRSKHIAYCYLFGEDQCIKIDVP